MKHHFATAAMLLLLAGCATRRPADDDFPSTPHAWKKHIVQAPISAHDDADQWAVGWNLDDDPELRDLIIRATRGSLAKAVSLLRAQVEAGRTSRLPLIATQTEEVLAQEAMYEAERDRLASSVALLRALGIAWTRS